MVDVVKIPIDWLHQQGGGHEIENGADESEENLLGKVWSEHSDTFDSTYKERRTDTHEGLPFDAGDWVTEEKNGCSKGSSGVDKLK